MPSVLRVFIAAVILAGSLGWGGVAGPLSVRPAVAFTGVATTTDALNLRAAPSLDAAVLTVIPADTQVSVQGDPVNSFYPVSYAGTTGWASGVYLYTGGGDVAVTTDDLNLRSGPSVASGVITVIPAGATVTLTGGSSNDFVSVSYDGRYGWAYSAYLRTGAGGTSSGWSPSGTRTVLDDLYLRAGPSFNDAVYLVMPRGSLVTLTGGARNGFVSVTYGSREGWAYANFLGSAGTAPPSAGAVPPIGSGKAIAAATLNFRSGPGTQYQVQAIVPEGTTVTLTGVGRNGFYYVVYAGQKGWLWAAGLLIAPGPGNGPNYTREEVIGFIYAAADRYGQSRSAMLRVAECESNLNPNAVNPTGSYGLFQFVRSTWDTTPYAQYDIFDAWASANAAGWMWSVGRRGEWVCQ